MVEIDGLSENNTRYHVLSESRDESEQRKQAVLFIKFLLPVFSNFTLICGSLLLLPSSLL